MTYRSTYIQCKRCINYLEHLLSIRSLSWQISGMMMKYENISSLLRSFKQLLFLHSLSSAKDNPWLDCRITGHKMANLKHCCRGAAVVCLKHCYPGAAVVYLKHCYCGRVVTLRPQSCNHQTRPQKSYFKTLLPQYRSRSTAVVSFYNSRASVNYLERIRILYH